MDPLARSVARSGPIIVTGKGGSGTRLISQLVSQSGVFLGNRLNHQGDSLEWVDLVYEMSEDIAGRPETPVDNRYSRRILDTTERILGQRGLPSSAPWGLKLPELMIVLPFFANTYSDGRIIHLLRHPVSACVRRSHMTSRLDNRVGRAVLPAAYRYCGVDPNSISTDDVYLHNAYSWKFQVERVNRYLHENFCSSRFLEVRYEDICADSSGAFQRVSRFIGSNGDLLARLDIDERRTNSWRTADSRVQDVWRICGDVAEQLGYSIEKPFVERIEGGVTR